MRILFALHTWHPEGRGGTEMHAYDLAQALMARGHQVGVFVRTARPDRPAYEVTTEKDGLLGVTRINHLFEHTTEFEGIYRDQRVHEAFEREVQEFRPDLVHIHHLTGLSTTIVELLKARGIPVVHTIHDFWNFCPRGQRMTRDLELCEDIDRRRCARCLSGMWPHWFGPGIPEREVVDARGRLAPAKLAEWDRHMAYALSLCDLLITPSEFHRERLLENGLPPDRTVALPHGLDISRFENLPPRDPQLPVRKIGYIGSLIPPKGAHVLIEAFLALGRPELSLHLHGEEPGFHEDHGYGERLRAMLPPGASVHFHGAYDPEHVPRILRGLDILVIPSIWWETFCLTLREGLLDGVPVLGSDHGALREALDGETEGLLFRAGDAADLVRKLTRLIEEPSLRARLSNRGEAVKRMKRYAEEIERLYERAAQLSRERDGKIAVARPWFPAAPTPKPEPAPAPRGRAPRLDWDRLEVEMENGGPLDVALERSGDDDRFGVRLQLKEGERPLGEIRLNLDVSAAAEAPETTERASLRGKVQRVELSRRPGRRRRIELGAGSEAEDAPEPEED